MDEADRNKMNRNSETDRPSSTTGPISHARKAQELKEKYKDACNVDMVYSACHISDYDPDTGIGVFPDSSTERHFENLHKEADSRGIDLTKQTDISVLTPLLDTISGGHHGGYERGKGLGPTRAIVKRYESNCKLQLVSSNEQIKRLQEENKKLKEENQVLKESQNVCGPTLPPSATPSSTQPLVTPTPSTLPNVAWQHPSPPPPWYLPPWHASNLSFTQQAPFQPPSATWLQSDRLATSNIEATNIGETLAAAVYGGWNGMGGFSQTNGGGV